MIKAQGLEGRGLLPGDVLYIYTGWSELWKDLDVDKVYYTKGPGLSYDAVKYLETRGIVLGYRELRIHRARGRYVADQVPTRPYHGPVD